MTVTERDRDHADDHADDRSADPADGIMEFVIAGSTNDGARLAIPADLIVSIAEIAPDSDLCHVEYGVHGVVKQYNVRGRYGELVASLRAIVRAMGDEDRREERGW